MSGAAVRVAVVSSSPAVGAGLANVLAAGERDTSNVRIVAERRTLSQVPITEVDVIVMHCRRGFTQDELPCDDIRVIVGTHDDELLPAEMVIVIRSGARGLLSLSSDLANAANACKIVASNLAYISPALAALIFDHLSGDAAVESGSFGLTPMEARILRLLAEGCSIANICETTGLKLRTVKHHLSNVYAKLGVSGAGQAIARAYRVGLVA